MVSGDKSKMKTTLRVNSKLRYYVHEKEIQDPWTEFETGEKQHRKYDVVVVG